MTARRGPRAHGSGPSWTRHPVAVPVGVALLTVALLSGVAGVAAHEAGLTVQRSAQDRVRSNRDAAVRALERQSRDFETAVVAAAVDAPVIAALGAPNPAAHAAAQDELSGLTRIKGAPAAFVGDPQGRLVAVYPAQPGLLGQDFSFRDWFKGVSRTQRPYVSAAYRTASSGKPLVVAVVAPVRDGSRVVGSVAVLWQLDSVRAVIDGARVDDGVTVVVTDQHGRPLADTLRVDERGEVLPVEVSATTRQVLAGHSVNTVADGTFESAARVAGLGWTVTAVLPSAVALAPARAFARSVYVTLGVTLLLVLAATLLACRFARRSVAEREAMRAAEAALRFSEDRFRRVFDEALTGKLLVDRHGDVVRVNAALAAMVGRAEQQVIGQPLVAIFADAADRSRILELIGAGEGEIRGEMALSGTDGSEVWGLVALSWMSGLDGEQVLLAHVEDATAEVTVNRAQGARLRAKDYFLSHVSHELRAPLAVVHQFASLLTDGVGGPLTGDQQEFLAVVTRNVRQLRVMIDDLLEVTRSDDAGLVLECRALAIGPVLTGTVARYASAAQQRHIAMSLGIGDLPLVVGNAEGLAQVLAHVLDNALRFTPEGGQVAVEAVTQDGHVRVSVRDSGRGIRLHDQDRVFEQFYQVDDDGEESRNGLGLGLYICRDVIERHGGAIWAASTFGSGTTVAFTVPILVRPAAAPAGLQHRG